MTSALWKRSVLASIALVLFSALLFGLAYPPLRWRWVAWIALAPFLVALRRSTGAGALLLAWLWSVAAAYAVGDWMPRAIHRYYQQPLWFGWAFFLGTATVTAAPYFVAFAWVARRAAARAGLRHGMRVVVVTCAWVGAELARGRLLTELTSLTGNPWALVGYSQVGWDVLVQAASIGGVYAVGFPVVAFNAALAEFWLSRASGAARSGIITAGILPGLLSIAYGASVLGRDPQPAEADASEILLVQGDVRVGSRWRASMLGRNLDTYLELTIEGARSSPPRLVLWPESAFTFFLERDEPYRLAIGEVLGGLGTSLVAGGVRFEGPENAPTFFNTIWSIDSVGAIVGRYDKQKLLPFGEYFPFSSLELVRRSFQGVRTFAPGGEPRLLPSPLGPLAVATCNEAMLPELVAERVALGGSVIVNPSNDTWIPEPRFAEQQLDIVSLRAVEQRRPLLRVSTSGPSAVIDEFGRIIERTEMNEAAWLSARVSPRSDRTWYALLGDAFALLCGGIALALAQPFRR